jgi:hypothetical protein
MPIGIQRKRSKGWKLPAGAVCVSRGTRWGNPWRAEDVARVLRQGARGWSWCTNRLFLAAMTRPGDTRADYAFDRLDLGDLPARVSVELYRRALLHFRAVDAAGFDAWLAPLRGKDLACWCDIGAPCHRDVLLAWANPEILTLQLDPPGGSDHLPHLHLPGVGTFPVQPITRGGW